MCIVHSWSIIILHNSIVSVWLVSRVCLFAIEKMNFHENGKTNEKCCVKSESIFVIMLDVIALLTV